MSIGPQLRALFQERPAVRALTTRDRIHQNQPPDGYAGTYLFFARQGIEREEVIDEPEGDEPFRQTFDVEAISTDPDDAMSLGDAIRGLHAYRGALGSGQVQGVFVQEQADDYEPRGLNSSEALHFAALQIEIVGFTP